MLVLAVLAVAQTASALFVPGGGNSRSDCYAGFDVEARGCHGLLQSSPNRIYGFDDGGECTFRVRLCTDVAVPGCRAATVVRFPTNSADLPIPPVPASGRSCGSAATITVPARGRGVRMHVVAVAKGRPRRDRDTLVLRCRRIGAAPIYGALGVPATLPSCADLPSDRCPPNPAGGPNELDVTLAGSGTDLDVGWTGTFHNFAVPGGSTLKLCALGCDRDANPLCGVCGPTGAGSINGELLGQPVPLIAANVPLCVANRLASDQPIRGAADIRSGDVNVVVDLRSDVFLTTAAQVCAALQWRDVQRGAERRQVVRGGGDGHRGAGGRRQVLLALPRLSSLEGDARVRRVPLRPPAAHVGEGVVLRSAPVPRTAGRPVGGHPRAG